MANVDPSRRSSQGDTWNAELKQFYESTFYAWRPEGLPFIDSSGLSELLKLLAGQRAVSYKEDLVCNFEKRLLKACKLQVRPVDLLLCYHT